MLREMIIQRKWLCIAGVVLLGVLSGCDSDSPTAPSQTPGQTPGGGSQGNGSFNVNVTANPGAIELVTENVQLTSAITITVRRTSDNSAPQDGSTLTVSTSLGTFAETGTASAVAQMTNGQVSLTYIPPSVTGTATVQATFSGDQGSAQIVITEPADPPPFFMSHVQPSVGEPSGGERVTIVGGGFIGPANVLFGGVNAQVLSVESDKVRVVAPPSGTTVPTGSSRTVGVSLTIGVDTADQASTSLSGAYTYARGGTLVQPRIFTVTPTTGPNEGGTQIQINGSGFQAPIQVLFRPTSSTPNVEAEIVSISSSQILVISPEATAYGQGGLNSEIDIEVINLDSGFSDTAVRAFRYGVPVIITSISPGEGRHQGGELVTLFGQGFDEPVAVGLANVAQTPISVSGREIIVRTSAVVIENCTDVSGPSQVTNIDSGDSGTGPNFIYRVLEPVITGVSPNTGDEDGGYSATISGLGFEDPVRVRFGDQAVTVTSFSPTSLTVSVPNYGGGFETQDCEIAGVSGNMFVPAAIDVSVENLLTECTNEFEGGFSFIPDDTSCRIDTGGGGGGGGAVDPPVASFTSVQLVATTTMLFNDTSTNTPTRWVWDFDNDGTPEIDSVNAADAAPSYDFGAAGNYAVRLTVHNAGGSDSVLAQVTVN